MIKWFQITNIDNHQKTIIDSSNFLNTNNLDSYIGLKYYYSILIIFKGIYLTYRWVLNKYYHFWSKCTWKKWQLRSDSFYISGTGTHHQM